MTNDMRQTVTTRTTDTCGTIGRRTGRAFTVAAGAVGPLLLWVVNDPWAGLDIAVRQGATTRHIGPVAVVLTGLVAGLAAWGLLAVLERTVRRPARTFRIVALVVLVLSLTGPVSGGVGTGSRLALLGMHLTVGAALIIGLPCRRPGAGDARRF